jgi:hypothetical protein
VWPYWAPNNSEKIPDLAQWSTMHRSLKIQTFKLTQNDPTLFVENTIFIELGLCYSHHYINTVEDTVDVL